MLILGDNLNDYKRDYYVKDVDERFDIMSNDRDHYGDKFIILPNPTDGHWVRAMFGTSEPEPNDENLMILQTLLPGMPGMANSRILGYEHESTGYNRISR